MKDAFYEQLVPGKPQKSDILLCIVSVFALLFLTVAGMNFIGFPVIFVSLLLFILLYRFMAGRLKTEYEYYLLNYELDITAIYNRETRKTLTEFDIRNAEIIAPVDSPSLSHYQTGKTLDFTSGNKNAKRFSIIIAMDHHLHNVIIEPDEMMLNQMKNWMGSKMFLN